MKFCTRLGSNSQTFILLYNFRISFQELTFARKKLTSMHFVDNSKFRTVFGVKV